MKITNETRELLINLAVINKNFLFKRGASQTSINHSNSIYMDANIEFDMTAESGLYELYEAGVYDITKVVAGINSLECPEIIFSENSLSVIGGDTEMIFALTDRSKLKVPTKTIKFPDLIDCKFELSSNKITQIINYAKTVYGSTKSFLTGFVLIVGDGRTINALVQESNRIANDVLKINLGECDQTFRFMVSVDNLKLLMKDDYVVEYSPKRICRFSCKSKKAIYYCSTEIMD